MDREQLEQLEYSWSAEVRLDNNLVISIWYTAWPMLKSTIKEVLSISSDYPKHKVNRNLI